MSTLTEWPDLLRGAAKTVQDIRAHADPTATPDPPVVAIGPPSITWEGYSGEPTSATYPVYVVVALDSRSIERLVDLAPKVAAAIAELTEAVVLRAEPNMFNGGGPALPCYEITVEVSLQ